MNTRGSAGQRATFGINPDYVRESLQQFLSHQNEWSLPTILRARVVARRNAACCNSRTGLRFPMRICLEEWRYWQWDGTG
jgi:hypothetical protein